MPLKIDEIIVLNDKQTVIADGVQYDFMAQPLPKQHDDCKLCAFKGAGQCNEIPCDNQDDDIAGYFTRHQ
jgi:hypothetical protein